MHSPEIARRFWAKVDMSGSCWTWTGTPSAKYGSIRVGDGSYMGAHRVAYELTIGPITPSNTKKASERWEVCHSCDTPRCVNPDHLFLGTRKQNAEDMCRKGRSLRGEKGRGASLSDEQVREIRSVERWPYGSMTRKAREFGINLVRLKKILNGAGWPHIACAKKPFITEEQVREIRRRFTGRYGQVVALAREYGVGTQAISRLVHNHTRKVA